MNEQIFAIFGPDFRAYYFVLITSKFYFVLYIFFLQMHVFVVQFIHDSLTTRSE